MKNYLNFRTLFASIGVVSLILLGFAYFFEYHYQLEPCPLCLLQRYTLWAIVFVVFIGVLQNCKSFGKVLYSLGVILFSTLGAILSARHVWLQHLPPGTQMPSCTAGLEKMLAFKPFFEVMKEVFIGSEGCTKIDFTILGLSLSAWTLCYFIALILFCVWLIMRVKNNSRSV